MKHRVNIMRSKAGHYWVTVHSATTPGLKLREQFSNLHQARANVARMVASLP